MLLKLWSQIPPKIQAALHSAVVSVALGAQTVFFTLLGAAITTNHFSSPGVFLSFCLSNYWSFGIGPILAALYRARQGVINTANTIVLPDGTKAVIQGK